MGGSPARLVLGLRVAVAIVWVAAVLVELPYHLSPRVPQLGHPILGIIGDSVTAGMGEQKAVTWPRIFADRYGVVVHDHSLAGANVASALRQAASVSSDERLVLLEIGGNDILGETTPAGFEAGLAGCSRRSADPAELLSCLSCRCRPRTTLTAAFSVAWLGNTRPSWFPSEFCSVSSNSRARPSTRFISPKRVTKAWPTPFGMSCGLRTKTRGGLSVVFCPFATGRPS